MVNRDSHLFTGLPDGVESFTRYDAACRVEYFRRGAVGSTLMEASYTYLANGLVDTVTYGNNTAGNNPSIEYLYDAANRLLGSPRTACSAALLGSSECYCTNGRLARKGGHGKRAAQPIAGLPDPLEPWHV